jgi:hypothetical protein
MKATMVSRTPAVEISLAAPAKADVNTDFANQLHSTATARPATTTRAGQNRRRATL